jgi:hypothetical protein
MNVRPDPAFHASPKFAMEAPPSSSRAGYLYVVRGLGIFWPEQQGRADNETQQHHRSKEQPHDAP